MPTATSTEAGWRVEHTIAAAGEKILTFNTKDTFVDNNILAVITTPSASVPVIGADADNTLLNMGTATAGIYYPTNTINYSATTETAGWSTAGTLSGSMSVTVGKVNQSTLKNGNTTITSGSTITPGPATQTITISEGYNTARTLTIGSTSSGTPAVVSSGTATISTVSASYDSTNDNYVISGTGDVSAPVVGTAGYISSSIGTLNANANGAVVNATMSKIALTASISGTGTKTPSISKDSDTNITKAGTATTTKPSSGYYVAVKSAANTATVTATPSVTSAGYGSTVSGQYTATASASFTVGASASSVTYIPIDAATFANSGTTGITYTDISSSAPILISNDYLYINEGYVTNQKISLARLVPDGASAALAAGYILSGYSAYNNDGILVAGSIPTYGGSYTVT